MSIKELVIDVIGRGSYPLAYIISSIYNSLLYTSRHCFPNKATSNTA
jgi:hypothetical protein